MAKYFNLQTDETTDTSVTQQLAIMLRFFDNTLGSVCCVFFTMESLDRATAELLFQGIDKHFQVSNSLNYNNLASWIRDRWCERHVGATKFDDVSMTFQTAWPSCM